MHHMFFVFLYILVFIYKTSWKPVQSVFIETSLKGNVYGLSSNQGMNNKC